MFNIGDVIRVTGNSKICIHYVPINAVGVIILGPFQKLYGDRSRVEFEADQTGEGEQGMQQWIAHVDMEPYESTDEEGEWDE